ncbi:MAG: glycosyltransferase family 4 protein [Planctomycetota bacterium]
MKILWHMPTLQTRCCGLSRRALQLAKEFAHLGWQIEFAVHAAKTDCRGDLFGGFRLIQVDAPQRGPLHWAMQSIARQRNAEAVVRALPTGHDVFVSCQPEAVLAYKAATPTVFVCGGTAILHEASERSEQVQLPMWSRGLFVLDRHLRRRTERKAFRTADAVVFDSDTTRRRVMAEYELRGENLYSAIGGVDSAVFVPAGVEERIQARRHVGVEADTFVIVWTGRLSPEKNGETLLRAIALDSSKARRVILVGDGPERARLETLARELGLSDVVRFTGACDDVRPYLHAADAFAFPSRGESFGGSLAEAMACGLACVALRSSGCVATASEEIIEDGVSGLLAPEATERGLADALRRLQHDPALRATLGAAARRRAETLFTWKRAGASLNDVLTRTLRSSDIVETNRTKRNLTCVLPST